MATLTVISLSGRPTLCLSWLPVSLSCVMLITLFSSRQGTVDLFFDLHVLLAQKAHWFFSTCKSTRIPFLENLLFCPFLRCREMPERVNLKAKMFTWLMVLEFQTRAAWFVALDLWYHRRSCSVVHGRAACFHKEAGEIGSSQGPGIMPRSSEPYLLLIGPTSWRFHHLRIDHTLTKGPGGGLPDPSYSQLSTFIPCTDLEREAQTFMSMSFLEVPNFFFCVCCFACKAPCLPSFSLFRYLLPYFWSPRLLDLEVSIHLTTYVLISVLLPWRHTMPTAAPIEDSI